MSLFLGKYWYTEEKNQAHEKVFDSVNSIINSPQGASRQSSFSKYVRLYGNLEIPLSFGLQYSHRQSGSRLTYNVVKSCCDTLTSKITQQSPSVMFLTDGEDFFKQEKAKLATKYIAAAFYAHKFKTKAKKAFLHGALFGKGFIKVAADKGSNQLIIEEVLPLEMFADPYDSIYGKPRNLFQKKVINKDALMAAFSKHKDAIRAAKNSSDNVLYKLLEQTDVIEAWRLPSSPDAGDGRHVICIDGATLLDEEWEKSYFPFVMFDFTDPILGFWPDGVGDMLIGLQLEINKTLKVIRKIMEFSVPKLILPAGSSVATQQLSNYVMDIIKVIGGGNPQVMQLATANPQLFQYLSQLFAKAYELVGISELSAQAKKPGGLNSGRAIRNFYQIESERYAVTEQKWEEIFVDAARLVISEIQDLEENEFISITKEGIDTISWKDIDLKQEEYKIQAFPVSALPKTPAGRLETVTDLIQAGYISKEQGLELLNYPDINKVADLDLSGRRLVRKIVDRIMLKNEYTEPEMFFDLNYCLEYSQKNYTLGKLNNIPEERLQKLVQFMSEVEALQQKLKEEQIAAAMPPGGIPGAAPQARPELAPVSDLLKLKVPGAPTPTAPLPEAAPEGMPEFSTPELPEE